MIANTHFYFRRSLLQCLPIILLLCTVLYTCTERTDWDLIKDINKRNSGRKEISFLPQPEWIFPGQGCICGDQSSTREAFDTVASASVHIAQTPQLSLLFSEFLRAEVYVVLASTCDQLSSFLSTLRLHCKIIFAASSVVVL
jgi:hypothetical protein